ncbi:MAG: hypothetical protein DI536_01275 [Archangium gephyra]|uniref:Rieske domain-containing protein n=1 Tax=Archangium gephyra TaxID=48 RepID=A0A2W5TS34_9BACT|nr:MAG: hypothetical protein DI536_01275 [Archangium gephyra]
MFIRQQWYAALPSVRLKSKPVAITRFGTKLVLWRDARGNAVCMVDRCAHRLAQLSRGRVRDGCLECPYHGLRYDSEAPVFRFACSPSRSVKRAASSGCGMASHATSCLTCRGTTRSTPS